MRFKFTNIYWEDGARQMLRDVAMFLENSLNRLFLSDSFGRSVDQITVVAVIVSDDTEENNKFADDNNKVGFFANPINGERIRYLSFALPFTPKDVDGISADEYKKLMCCDLSFHLDRPGFNIPKDFDYMSFSKKIKIALEILSSTSVFN